MARPSPPPLFSKITKSSIINHQILVLVLVPVLVVVLETLPGCASPPPPLTPQPPTNPAVLAIHLPIDNVFLVMGSRPILIDTGTPHETEKIEDAIHGAGLRLRDLALIVVTHGHGDHAGGAKRLRDVSGAPVLAGEPDLPVFESGHNREMKPIGLTAHLIRASVDFAFEPFAPDLLVRGDAPFDLRPYGVEGRAIPTPGHTPGSISVLLASGDCFVGDLFSGGYLGGAIAPETPTTHYFHDDQAASEAHVAELVKLGAKRFFLGHGGPVEAQDALAAFGGK
ncbi:MAG TPA: MBL fold metallo-hydrolase [Planctomycetota bacterium]|nr:MBL fold metallo-hydrolase [Planctomycetota bacterium]